MIGQDCRSKTKKQLDFSISKIIVFSQSDLTDIVLWASLIFFDTFLAVNGLFLFEFVGAINHLLNYWIRSRALAQYIVCQEESSSAYINKKNEKL